MLVLQVKKIANQRYNCCCNKQIVKNNAINDNGKLNQAMQTMKAKNSPRQNTENDQLSSKKSVLARLTTRL